MTDNSYELSAEDHEKLAALAKKQKAAGKLFRKRKFPEALAAYDASIKFAMSEQAKLPVDDFVTLLMSVGYCYVNISDWGQAVGAYQRIELILKQEANWEQAVPTGIEVIFPEQFDASSLLATLYDSMGVAHDYADQRQDAEKYYQQAIDIYMRLEQKASAAQTWYYVGFNSQRREEWANVKRAGENILSLANEINDTNSKVLAWQFLAHAYSNEGDLDKAAEYLKQAVAAEKKMRHPSLDKDEKFLDEIEGRITQEKLARAVQAARNRSEETDEAAHGQQEQEEDDARAVAEAAAENAEQQRQAAAAAAAEQQRQAEAAAAAVAEIAQQQRQEAEAAAAEAAEQQRQAAEAAAEAAKQQAEAEAADAAHVAEQQRQAAAATAEAAEQQRQAEAAAAEAAEQQRQAEEAAAWAAAAQPAPTMAAESEQPISVSQPVEQPAPEDTARAAEQQQKQAVEREAARKEQAEAAEAARKEQEAEATKDAAQAQELAKSAMRVLERFALIHSGPRRLVTQPAKQALFGLITRQKEIAKTFWAVDIEETQVVKSDGWKGTVSSATLDLHQSPKAVINVTVDSSDAYTLQIMAAPRNAPQESPRVAISKNIDADPEQLAETLDDWLKEGILDISRDLLRYTK